MFFVCFTGPCDAQDPDEVDILALIGEEIPKYRLRADSTTDYSGHNYCDSFYTAALSRNEDLLLSPDQFGQSQKCSG